MLKISSKPKLHICDKHIELKILGRINSDIAEYQNVCSICGKIKEHWAYGYHYVLNYKETDAKERKKHERMIKKKRKNSLDLPDDLPF